MNREAVALGTPVFTTFEGRLGAVDEQLLREGGSASWRMPARCGSRSVRCTSPTGSAAILAN